MNKIDKTELFEHLGSFLKTKGVELKEGSYARRIEQGCGLLADAVNLSQRAVECTKAEMDKRLDQMRQVIHEKTAPKAPASQPQPASAVGPAETASTRSSSRKAPKAKGAAARRKPAK